MNRKHLLLGLFLSVGLSAGLNSSAQAQPDPNAAPKGENPPNWNWNPGQGRQGGRARVRFPLTPEQIQQMREQQVQTRITSIKVQLTRAGFTDQALQTAVANAYKEQTTAQSDLATKWQKITTAVRLNNTPETEMTALLKDFRDSVDKENARRTATSKALEEQFQVSKKPLLDALLMTSGITGNEATIVGQTGAINQAMNLLGGGGLRALGDLLRRPGMMENAQIFGGAAREEAEPPAVFW